MTTLVIQTPQEPTDTTLPIDYRDDQLNLGSLFAVDFRFSRCAPGPEGPVANDAPLGSLLEVSPAGRVVKVGSGSSVIYYKAGKLLDLTTTSEIMLAAVSADSAFKLVTGRNFGVVIWCKINSSVEGLSGIGRSIAGFSSAGAAAPNKTPGLLVVEKRRRNLLGVDIAADSIGLSSHGLSNGARVEFGGTLPGGLAVNTLYYVISATADAFKVSATLGGAPIDLTNAGGSFYVMDNVFRPKVYSPLGGDLPTSRNINDPAWNIPAGKVVQLAFGWSVENGVGRSTLIINGGAGKVEATSTAIVTLPTTGFGDFAIGPGSIPYQTPNQPSELTLYRTLVEDLTVSGRSLTEMAQADWAANSLEILAR